MAQIIEAGTYRAKAVEGALGETSGGREQVAVRFALLDQQQQFITWYGYFTEKTLETTLKALRVAGWRGQDLTDLSDLAKEDAPEVLLVVEHETDQQGVTRARVRWVNSPGGVGLKAQLPADKAKVFAAKMKGAIAAFDKKAKTPRAMPPAQPTVPQEVLDAQESEHEEPVPF